MSKDELEAIFNRLSGVTEGPWAVVEIAGDIHITYEDTAGGCYYIDEELDSHDATFIANARKDIPALFGHIDVLEQRIKDMELALASRDRSRKELRNEIEGIRSAMAQTVDFLKDVVTPEYSDINYAIKLLTEALK